jgi:hypothetical protein
MAKDIYGLPTMTRQDISVLIQTKRDLIEATKKEIEDLVKQWHLTSDDKQWFTEKMETVKVKEGRKYVEKQWLIGKINWKENFKDESTGKIFTLDRCKVVRVNGGWEW